MHMNINQDLQEQLFRQREEQICHLDYNQEFRYYNAVASGDMESVKEYLMPENDDAYSGSEYGKLSQNSLCPLSLCGSGGTDHTDLRGAPHGTGDRLHA